MENHLLIVVLVLFFVTRFAIAADLNPPLASSTPGANVQQTKVIPQHKPTNSSLTPIGRIPAPTSPIPIPYPGMKTIAKPKTSTPPASPGSPGGKVLPVIKNNAQINQNRINDAAQSRGLSAIKHNDLNVLPGIGSVAKPGIKGPGIDTPGTHNSGSLNGAAAGLNEHERNNDKGWSNISRGQLPAATNPQQNNNDAPQAGRNSNGLKPSANPKDWMSGSSNVSTTHNNPDGSRSIHSILRNDEEGTTTEATTTIAPNGNSVTNSTIVNDNGTTTTVMTENRQDGSSRTMTTVSPSKANGDVGSHTVRETDSQGRVTHYERDAIDNRAHKNIDKLIDPNSDTSGGSQWSGFDHTAKKGAPVINQVNPGHGNENPNPQAPRLNPGNSIVTNPASETIRDAAQASDWTATKNKEALGRALPAPGAKPLGKN